MSPKQELGALSQREVEVLRLISAGKSNREIAEELVITLDTVFRHVGNIFTKTSSANRTEAAGYAGQQGAPCLTGWFDLP